jgi:medium-chain acyl-[acyl-carrier-protein] hydrolase
LPALRWFAGRFDPAVRARLVCFPFAGSGASTYRPWCGAFGSSVNVCAVQLPGREDRLADAPYVHVTPLVDALTDVLEPVLAAPYALFGHSMGALIAFELTRRLQRLGRPLPRRLFLSGHRSPDRQPSAAPIHALPDREFLDALRRFGGTPDVLLNDPEFVSLALPVLRADFTLCETYSFSPGPALDVPVTVLAATRDRHVPAGELEGWGRHSSRETRVRMFEGDHFFVQAARADVIRAVAGELDADGLLESDAKSAG